MKTISLSEAERILTAHLGETVTIDIRTAKPIYSETTLEMRNKMLASVKEKFPWSARGFNKIGAIKAYREMFASVSDSPSGWFHPSCTLSDGVADINRWYHL